MGQSPPRTREPSRTRTRMNQLPLHEARLRLSAPPCQAILKLLAVYALACLVIASMELTRVLTEGIAIADYLPDLKGRAFFTVTPLLALTLLFLWCLTGRLGAAFLVSLTGAFALLLAHLKKMEVLEKPLVPGDFTQIREAVGVLDAVLAGEKTLVALIALALAAALGVFIALLCRRPRWPLPRWFRLAYGLAFVLAIACEVRAPWLKHVFEKQKLDTVGWNYDLNLRRHGLLLSLLLDARQVIYRPMNYSREAVEEALGRVPPPGESPEVRWRRGEGGEDHLVQPPISSSARCGGLGGARPDVILFLGESFWDLTALDVRLSRDPVPNFHRFQREEGFRHGTMLSPSFAGSTGNVEFEILTGIPLAVLPEYSTPYSNYLIRPVEALPSIFQRSGYRTRAIHNYFHYYYQRFAVYPRLGFEEFISLEDLEPMALSGQLPARAQNLRAVRHISRGDYDALFDGQFPSDEPLVLRVLEELNKAGAEQTRTPQFIFAISMVSHGRYQGERFPAPDVEVLDTSLPEMARREIENYANALFRADLALGHLMDELKKRERPTIVAFFGDHLPSLTAETYAAAGMEFGPLEIKKYEVPVFLWSNYPMAEVELPETFGAHLLGVKLLRAARVEASPYFNLIGSLEKDASALGHRRFQAGAGTWFAGVADPDLPESARAARDDLFLLAYDRLFGHQFSAVDGGVPEDIESLATFEVRAESPWKAQARPSIALKDEDF